ncbi:MAG TPA: hypothetical protein VNI20_08915 [Fimbriimonadaceae bacterium]|nr:hypothetical protein [Fimbriimonadaceae bacterium]
MKAKKSIALPLLIVLIVFQGWMQNVRIFPYWQKYYSPRTDSDLSSLSPDQLFFALAGFREMIAGLLWVRADSYFDEGNYDAILPMIRIVTMLDPKQLDVYTTGMWHIAYNFTDEANRSDRRYIAPALALGEEGSRLNDYTYEIYFETGFIWYNKVDDDYDQAVKWFEKANSYDFDSLFKQYKGDGMSDFEAAYHATANAIPAARRNIMSKVYLRAGMVDKAKQNFYDLLQKAQQALKDNPKDYETRVNRDTIEGNLDNLLVRMAQRGQFARERGETDFTGYDVDPPFDVGFSARVTVLEPKLLLVEGTWGVLPVGTRVRFILRDADYPGAVPGGMKWDKGEHVDFKVPPDETFLEDQLFVKNRRFSRKIDMSRDVTMYPLVKDKYVLEFYYNPRSAPQHIQDKFGFNGEGMTDKSYLNTEIRPGQRVVFATLEMPKEMIYMTGKYRQGREPAVVQTPNFTKGAFGSNNTEIIKVPGLRSN